MNQNSGLALTQNRFVIAVAAIHGMLKSWNLLKAEIVISEEQPIGVQLGDPEDFSRPAQQKSLERTIGLPGRPCPMSRGGGEAEDAGGRAPAKDDNEVHALI